MGKIGNKACCLAYVDADFAKNLNVEILEGKAPISDNEIMLEKWYMNKLCLKLGDTAVISLPGKTKQSYKISGIINDWGATKAAAIPFVLLSEKTSNKLSALNSQFFILFKDGVNIQKVRKDIASYLNISNRRIGYNERLLALMLQTNNNRVIQFYAIGAFLFILVLITAVIMIYNTFNISVMDRVRQFGLLRCIGASKKQIKKLVRRESLIISVKAIPPGVLAGMFMSFCCSAILRFYNPNLYKDISIFSISAIGIGLGILTGFLTVFIASLLPAKRASKISPVNAVSGSTEIKASKAKKKGILTKLFNAEIALGINNALNKKLTLTLMSSSIAISIVLFLAFSVLVNPMFLGINTSKAYTPDIYLSADAGINNSVFKNVSSVNGVKNIFGRMDSFVNASFDLSKLIDNSKKISKNNIPASSEKSWLVSYDKQQLGWAKAYLSRGICDEDKLNKENGIISVRKLFRNNKLIRTENFKLGDKISIQTKQGKKEFMVMGIMDIAPYSNDKPIKAMFITTESFLERLQMLPYIKQLIFSFIKRIRIRLSTQ